MTILHVQCLPLELAQPANQEIVLAPLREEGGSDRVLYDSPDTTVKDALDQLFQAKARRLHFDDYTPVGDGVADDTVRLLALMTDIAALENVIVDFSPKKYLITSPTIVSTITLKNAVLNMNGAEIIVAGAPGENKYWFGVFQAVTGGGDTLIVNNLRMRLNRPGTRISNSDSASFRGFRRYFFDKPVIESSDNMGLVFGRGESSAYIAESVFINCPIIGGRYESTPHSHASIGDSGIWITNAPKVTHIVSPVVTSTGDDAILVGHTDNPAAGRVFITDCDLEDVSNGLSIAASGGVITGKVKRTNNTGIYLAHIDGNTVGAGMDAEDLRVDLRLSEIGWMQAGETGAAIIPKVNPHGVFIFQGDDTAGSIDLTGTTVDGCHGSILRLQPSVTFGGNITNIHGRLVGRRVGRTEAGAYTGDAVLRRAETSGAAMSNIRLSFEIADSDTPFVQWFTSGNSNDQNISLSFSGKDCTVPVGATNQPLIQAEVFSGTNRPQNFNVSIELLRCAYGRPIRYVGYSSDEMRQFNVRVAAETGGYKVARSSAVWAANNDPRYVLALNEFLFTKNAVTDELIGGLDPTKNWLIEVVSSYSADANNKLGAYLKVLYTYNTATPSLSTVTVIASATGASSTAYVVALNMLSTLFTAGALEIRTAPGFAAGATVRPVVIAKMLDNGPTVLAT